MARIHITDIEGRGGGLGAGEGALAAHLVHGLGAEARRRDVTRGVRRRVVVRLQLLDVQVRAAAVGRGEGDLGVGRAAGAAVRAQRGGGRVARGRVVRLRGGVVVFMRFDPYACETGCDILAKGGCK